MDHEGNKIILPSGFVVSNACKQANEISRFWFLQMLAQREGSPAMQLQAPTASLDRLAPIWRRDLPHLAPPHPHRSGRPPPPPICLRPRGLRSLKRARGLPGDLRRRGKGAVAATTAVPGVSPFFLPPGGAVFANEAKYINSPSGFKGSCDLRAGWSQEGRAMQAHERVQP